MPGSDRRAWGWPLVALAGLGLSASLQALEMAPFAAPTRLQAVVSNGELCVRAAEPAGTSQAQAQARKASGAVESSSGWLVSHLAQRHVNLTLTSCR